MAVLRPLVPHCFPPVAPAPDGTVRIRCPYHRCHGGIMRTRTPFGLAASGVAIAMLAAACGSPSDAVDDGEQTIELIISNHPWQRGIQPLIPEFEEETGISVNVQTFAEQQARDRIQLNLQSQSDAMDVYMTLPSREGPLFSSSGYYEPLDDYLADAPD